MFAKRPFITTKLLQLTTRSKKIGSSYWRLPTIWSKKKRVAYMNSQFTQPFTVLFIAILNG